jgi:hypothetical protein
MSIQLDNTDVGVFSLITPASNSQTWTFPISNGTTGQALQTDASGNLSWVTPSLLTLSGFTLTSNTTGTNATVNTSAIAATAGSINMHFALVAGTTTGNGPIYNSQAAVGAGNTRGNGAIDLQFAGDRVAATQVCSGQYAVNINSYASTNAGYQATSIGCENVSNAAQYAAAISCRNTSFTSGAEASVAICTDQSTLTERDNTILGGKYATDRGRRYQVIYPAVGYSSGTQTVGQSQTCHLQFFAVTTGTTAVTMSSDTFAGRTLSNANMMFIGANTAFYMRARVYTISSNGGGSKSFTIMMAGKKAATNASLTPVAASTITASFGTGGTGAVDCVPAYDTTNGWIQLNCIGLAATTFYWCASIELVEMGF